MQFIDLSDRKILVTGASSGIGQATAILLSQLGATVVLCARREKELNQTVAVMENPARHIVIPFDVRDFDNYDKLFERATADGVKLTGLVHSAGIVKAIPLKIMRAENINEIFEVNFTAFMCLIAQYIKKKFSNGGCIVGISAINAHYPAKCTSIYAASKGALEASIRTLALELSPKGIRINSVIPGSVRTPMIDDMDKETLKQIESKHLLGMETTGQIADVIVYLLSDRSSGITGRNVYADGGVLGQLI